MSIYDGLVILILVFGLFLGYQRGFVKQAVDFVVLLITMIIASPLSKLLCKLLYPVLPFFNFSGDAKGLKAINLIVWRLIIYFLLIAIILLIVRRIFIKLKWAAKIRDAIVDANFVSKILGIIMSVPLTIIVLYNVLIIVNVPLINFSLKDESALSKFVLEKTLIVSSENKDLYLSSNYARKQVFSKANTDENFENINAKIANNMVKNNLTTDEMLEELEDKDKLLGTRYTVIDEIEDETGVTSPTGYNTTHEHTTTEYRD